MADYLLTLLDPFSAVVDQPKLLDGKITRSSGVKLRHAGEYLCTTTNAASNMLLMPSTSSVLLFQDLNDQLYKHVAAFPNHLDSPAQRANVESVRVVSTGLRLSSSNTADQNEGWWEAVRIPVTDSMFDTISVDPVLTSRVEPINWNLITELGDLSNYSSYQTGKIRDLHRYQFKLNSRNTEHPFTKPDVTGGLNSPAVAATMVDDTFDMIIVRLHGRSDASSPTVIRYEAVSNQEIIYKENTALGRLMSSSPRVEEFQDFLDASRVALPAVQIM